MTENNALAIRKESSIIHSYDDAVNAATAMAKSGYFTDARDASQAIVKILAGQEMGFGAFASMSGIFIIQGRPSIGANLMASAVKGSVRYDYRVKEMSDTVCEIEFFERVNAKLVSIGVSKFTIDDARKAQTKNLDKFPRNMLFARAISNGVKWYCPDAFNGAAVYTPEELGAEVDGDGNVINIEPAKVAPVKVEPEPVYPTPEPKAAVKDEQPVKEYGPMTYEDACNITGSDGSRYGNATNAELQGKKIGILKALKNPNLDNAKQSAYDRKLSAIDILLAVPESERLERAGQEKLI